MRKISSDIAFTPAVQAIPERNGSRQAYARMEQRRGWQTQITADLAQFVAELDRFYLGTANAEGQPYIQYRGGAPGFLKVIDEHTPGCADIEGNRQYITLGNLSENSQAFLFLMDDANSQRVKLWGTARVIENDAERFGRLRDPTYSWQSRAGDAVYIRDLGQQLSATSPQTIRGTANRSGHRETSTACAAARGGIGTSEMTSR